VVIGLGGVPELAQPGGVADVIGSVHRYTPEGARAESLGSLPTGRQVNVGQAGMYPQRFAPYGFVAAGPAHAYLGWNEAHELRVVDADGTPARVQRWAGTLHPVTEEQRAIYRVEAVPLTNSRGDPLPAEAREMYRSIADGMVFPPYHGTFRELLVDAEGYVWTWRIDPRTWGTEAERAAAVAAPPVWDVFDPDGVWLDVVETPAGLTVTSIGRDHVAGVARNALGVERAQLHRLVRAGG
jgi:hypothetical protein